MSNIAYQLEGIKQSYPGRAEPVLALHEPLTILRGETFVLVGPSGSGKSTLLRLLGLIEPPAHGSLKCLGVRVDGRRLPALELRRRVVLVFQRPLLLTDSVRANVAYGLKLRGRRDINSEVDEALARVGLRELANSPVRTLSGGEAQRVALARALVVKPDVLLLDEPTANLDPYNVVLIEHIIQEARAAKRMTLVLVTHNIFQARRLAGRVGLMLNGQLVEVGTTEQFFESPRDPRARAFVRGEMVC